MENGPRHQCLIYAGSPSQKLPLLATVIHRMMADGYRCLYMNTQAMITGIWSSLEAMGIDVAQAIAETRLVFSSESVLDGDDFNVDQMLQGLDDELDKALRDGYKGLWASGDMSWELGPEKNFEKLLEYEWKLEELFKKRKQLHGICQYHYDTLSQQAMRRGLLMHRTILINETLSYLNPHYLDAKMPSEEMTFYPQLDTMIAELCGSNTETRRKAS